MKGILADINSDGQLETLLHIWESEEWREIWESLNLLLWSFEDLGLEERTADSILWQVCQDREIVLITANRNEDGPDSLEYTISTRNGPNCLPVFTLGDPTRLQKSKPYANRVAVKLLEYFLNIENVLGSGRLYVP